MTQNFYIEEDEADNFVQACVYATKNGNSPNDILQLHSKQFELDDMEVVQALLDRVVNLMNNTREWFLKGYRSEELHAEEKKHLKPLPASEAEHSAPERAVKSGRNESCPCGSGKK